VLIEDDGEQCTFLDEQGRIIDTRLVATVLSEVTRVDLQAESVAIYPADWQTRMIPPVNTRPIRDNDARDPQTSDFVSDPTRENMTRAMHRHRAVFGADGVGRFWFAETYPTCDALLTVVHLLQALSRSDDALSQVIHDVHG
jgi:phosphomannomutase